MFIEQILAGQSGATLLSENPRGIGQKNTLIRPIRCHEADQFIESAVAAKTQRVQIPRRLKVSLRLRTVIKRERALTLAVAEFGERVVQFARCVELFQGFLMPSFLLSSYPELIESFPIPFVRVGQSSAMRGCEWRAISQVHRYRADHYSCAAFSSETDDVIQI